MGNSSTENIKAEKVTGKAEKVLTPEEKGMVIIPPEEWEQLTEEQIINLKASKLKSKNGIGGEHFSTFPNLKDLTINTWVEEKYNISKLHGRVSENTFQQWASLGNGDIRILPIKKGELTHYLVTLLPNKPIKLDLWELDKLDIKPFLKYTTNNHLGEITLNNTHYHILNIYSQKNKAFNQGKLLVKLFQLGTSFKTMEEQKDLTKHNYLQLDIQGGKYILQEIPYTTHQPNGKTYQTLGEYFGRKQHQKATYNYLDKIN